jgi:para-aminobenzoate synthetase / 4-amino-4-deoxychorismate lyase
MKRLPFENIIGFLKTLDHFVLLETTKPTPENRYSYLFTNPVQMVSAQPEDVESFRNFWHKIESLTGKRYAAGYVPYENGYVVMDLPLPSGTYPGHKTVFGIYPEPSMFDHASGRFESAVPPLQETASEDYTISDISIRTSKEKYIAAVEQIKNHIAEGNTYQVNYTTRLDFTFSGSPIVLYGALRSEQPTAYSALMKYDDTWFLSLSPELFFRIDGSLITSRPMKGTMRRGRTTAEDEELAHTLQHDVKNRAENLMIVDLLRNDIGRIAETGSVAVPDLLTVEKYRSVLQMTSTITGTLRRSVQMSDIFEALFPCGSVTGAPKHRTMQIIRELEDSPRGIYTGAIGMIKPGRDAVFNVPIRTIEIRRDRGSMGIGSGIVWNSDPAEEYEECLLKAQFLTKPGINRSS